MSARSCAPKGVRAIPTVERAERRRKVGTRQSIWGSAAAACQVAIDNLEAEKKVQRKEKRPSLEGTLIEYQQYPVEFARDILGITTLDKKQIEILEAYAVTREISITSGNGMGKSFLFAIIAWHSFCCWEDVLVTFGSSVDRQVKINHWLPFRRLWRQAKFRMGPQPGLNHNSGYTSEDDRKIVFGASPKQKDDVMGTRSKRTVILLDESAGIPDDVNAGYENLMTGADSFKMNAGNPTSTGGWYRNKFAKHDELNPRVRTFALSCLDSVNVIAGREIIPGLVSREWVEERRRQWGEEDPRWQIHVLGLFLTEEETRIFPGEYLAGLWDPYADFDVDNALCVGVDLSDGKIKGGGDRTVAYFRRGLRVYMRRDYTGLNYEQVAIEILREIGDGETATIYYDATGLGGKFGRQFEDTHHKVIGVHFGERAVEMGIYKSARDEMPWHLRDWIRRGGRIKLNGKADSSVMLYKELEIAKFSYDARQRLVSNEKDSIRKSLGRSCDDYDALCLCTYKWESTITARVPKTTKRAPLPAKKRQFGSNFKYRK